MKLHHSIIAATAMLAVSACNSGEGDETSQSLKQAEETMEKDASDTSSKAARSEKSGLMDQVKEKASGVMETVTGGVALDTSSLEAFQTSLEDMMASLSPDQSDQLQSALGSLAKSAMSGSGSGGVIGAVKGMAAGKSTEEILYDNMKDKLDGLSFEQILALAG